MIFDTFPSPVGKITIATDGSVITNLHIEGDRYFAHVPNDWQKNSNHQLLQKAKKALEEYFAGKRKTFDFKFGFSGTPFQQHVWKALMEIPSGKTTTYKALAEAIGNPNAVRAVGTAVGRNPICIFIPCHRVLASDGTFGGYVAGVACKSFLLALEKRS